MCGRNKNGQTARGILLFAFWRNISKQSKRSPYSTAKAGTGAADSASASTSASVLFSRSTSSADFGHEGAGRRNGGDLLEMRGGLPSNHDNEKGNECGFEYGYRRDERFKSVYEST